MQLDVTDQNTGHDEQGLNTISLDGSTLTLVGWFDDVATWHAIVELTPEQLAELRRALG